MNGTLQLPKMDGTQVAPGIWLLGEPTPVPGTDKLRCLADVGGALCVVELSIKFGSPNSHDGNIALDAQPASSGARGWRLP